ncbi:MAG: SDR family oxidoreductase [Caldilineales bacterium]|nr:SDR family oxidoreductase [Caldilineales bacterium]
MQRFIGSVVVITGAARGIGQAMALRLAQEGARVAVLDLADLSQTAALCRQAGAEVIARTLDVSRRADILAAVEAILAAWGRLDVWVNNAGVFDDTPLAELSEDRWQQVIDVNTKAMFLCCQAVAPTMLAQGRGRIVNLSSMAAKVAFPNEVAYCSSKAAVLGLTRALAVELGPHGITVNAICPGPIDTDMLTHTYQRLADQNGVTLADWRARILETIPVGRYGRPADVAALAAFLASDDASFINGQAINIDGGMVFY